MTTSEARRIVRARPGTYTSDLVADGRAILWARPAQIPTRKAEAEAEQAIAELRALAFSLTAFRLNLGSVTLSPRGGER